MHFRVFAAIAFAALYAAGCGDSSSAEELCRAFGLVPDPARGACRCPNGAVELEDGSGCRLMDGGVLPFPDAGPVEPNDAGFAVSCRESEERPCPGGMEQGACEPGRQRCVGGSWSVCMGEVGPASETCNGADDDCDGIVDGPAAASTCGAVDRASSIGCTAGTCIVTACATGWADCDGQFENGCETPLGTDSNCLACGDACAWSSCRTSGCNDAVHVSGGANHSCAVRDDGSVVCWGAAPAATGVPAAVPDLMGAREVHSGGTSAVP
jgi:hypothetical protein